MQIVSSAAVLLQMMVFSRHFAVQAGLEIASHSECLAAHFRQFGEPVSVMVISILLTVLPEHSKSHLVVFCHDGSIERSVVVEG